MSGRVEVGVSGGQVRIRVSGRATHLVSQPLRDFAWQMIRRGHREFFVELADCIYLDSTFAGVLAGMSLRLKEVSGTVVLLRVPPRCAEMLTSLGIDKLFEVAEAAPVPPRTPPLQPLPSAARSREAWAGTILEAHRLLAEAERANTARFEDVVEYLKADASLPPGSDGRFRN